MDDFDPTQIAELRRRIEDELAELEALSEAGSEGSRPVELDQQSVGRISRMDAMQVQAMALASQKRRTARIDGLKAALRRLSDGEYGYCASCEEPIAFGRLKADPMARLCLACARLGET
ncbi:MULTISPECIES: TraR/DksA family transcriptional regulator [Afifella]|uniref:TraR/DksA family transcriptional regulator n=1 Tax=Afifella TaxID=643217 RepID=UPI000FE3F995|nr:MULTISPECIES: TraR/DksA C4-type zinc finger protein [Afifella]MCT8268178.1 TraR/DksA C4-type zinc finger protein [Afifella sp. JA880]